MKGSVNRLHSLYCKAKEQHRGHIVLVKCGESYWSFDNDAIKMCKILNVSAIRQTFPVLEPIHTVISAARIGRHINGLTEAGCKIMICQ